jgi:hypothetical protein
MFLWFSPQLTAQNTTAGDMNTLWSTVNNNRLAELWMGVTRKGEVTESLNEYLHRNSGQAEVMDTTGRVYQWGELPHENSDTAH